MSGKPLRFRAYATLLLSLVPPGLCGQQLPVRNYTTTDGLPHYVVKSIVRDSHGFLWFCTLGGLSRFDGYQFTNYGVGDGLPAGRVDALVETRAGDYWVGTAGGLCQFNPKAKPGARFTVYRPEISALQVNAVFEDRSGNLLCGTRHGLYRFRLSGNGAGSFQFIDIGISREQTNVTALIEDRYGSLWIGTAHGLFRRNPDGRMDQFWGSDSDWEMGRGNINSLFLDRQRALWVATWGGLWKIPLPALPDGPKAQRVPGLPGRIIASLLQSADGHLWTGSLPGLWEIDPERARVIRRYSKDNGVFDASIEALATDREGNLWMGTEGFGALRIARHAFSTFALENPRDIVESQEGELCVGGWLTISLLEGHHFSSIRPRFPSRIHAGWGWYQTILQDRTGDWWFPTQDGLFRFGPAASVKSLAGRRSKAVYTQRDGLASDQVFRLFEDRAGNIWVATIGIAGHNGLSRWERATGKWRHYSGDSAPSVFRESLASSFGQDRSGAIWIGFYSGQLGRFRSGAFQVFTGSDGWVGGEVRAIHEDRHGALWIASTRGLTCVLKPDAEHPRFQRFSTGDGLSGNDVRSLISDDSGRIYVGTGRGVDQIEILRTPNSIRLGRTRLYTTAEGLAPGLIEAAYRDRHGALWFAADGGVSRFEPEPTESHPSPALIRSLRVAGIPVSISELGETVLPLPALKPSQNNIAIEYSSLNFAPGETLRYQYMLEGADKGWGEPTLQRSVNYANLAPGRYRFRVRAAEGDADSVSNVLFTIDPPLWRRWWFLTLLATAIIAAGAALYRLRVRQLLELERLRTHIATDLHDDIGSNLSQIAILSQVALQNDSAGPNRNALARIAEVSRETVQSMSDIVWAVDPGHDHLSDLTNRMRRFANDVFDARNIKLSFRSCGEQEIRVPPDIRREIFLIFKECVNNAARHSGCDVVDVEFTVEDNRLELKLADNGRGVDASVVPSGHGLTSMRRRVQGLGGEIEVASREPGGVSVHLRVPLPTESYMFK